MSRLTSTNSKNLSVSTITAGHGSAAKNEIIDGPRKTSFMNFAEKRKATEGPVPKEETQNIPVMFIKKKEEHGNIEEDNNSFAIFSYLISDMLKNGESIQFPIKKGLSQSNSKGSSSVGEQVARLKREKIFSETETKGFSAMKNDFKDRDHILLETKPSVAADENMFGLNSININDLLQTSKIQKSTNQISTPKQHSYTVKSKTHSSTQNRDPSLGSKRKIFENPNENNSNTKAFQDPRKPLETSIRSNVILNTQSASTNTNLGLTKKTSQINNEGFTHEVTNSSNKPNFESKTINSKRGFNGGSNLIANLNANPVI
jgi:hypothetical protein